MMRNTASVRSADASPDVPMTVLLMSERDNEPWKMLSRGDIISLERTLEGGGCILCSWLFWELVREAKGNDEVDDEDTLGVF